MFKMPSISWHTGLKSLVGVLHTFSNWFLQQGSQDLLPCIHQLENCPYVSPSYTWFLASCPPPYPCPLKQHLDWFSLFCMACLSDQQTNGQTHRPPRYISTYIGIACFEHCLISKTAQPPGLHPQPSILPHKGCAPEPNWGVAPGLYSAPLW